MLDRDSWLNIMYISWEKSKGNMCFPYELREMISYDPEGRDVTSEGQKKSPFLLHVRGKVVILKLR